MRNSEDFKSYKNMDDWIRNKQFCDSDEVYTNGAELITVNDVLKGWNYYMSLTEERARADERKKIFDEFQEWLKTQTLGIDYTTNEILVVVDNRWELAIEKYKEQQDEK